MRYHPETSRHRSSWSSHIERRPMGSPIVDSRWELAPSARCHWLGDAQAGQVDTNRSPEDATKNADRWVPPWPVFDMCDDSTSGAPDWPSFRHLWVRLLDTVFPSSATTSVDGWVLPWSSLGVSWHPEWGAHDWVLLGLRQDNTDQTEYRFRLVPRVEYHFPNYRGWNFHP